jgi:hypothetical protein
MQCTEALRRYKQRKRELNDRRGTSLSSDFNNDLFCWMPVRSHYIDKRKSIETMSEIHSSSPLEGFSDDIFGTILSHCDFASAFILSTGTNKALKARCQRINLKHVWQDMFYRNNFAPIEEENGQDFLVHTQRRRKLLYTLMQSDRGNQFNNMPNRSLSFIPMLPEEGDKNLAENVESRTSGFQEDSFALTSSSESPELMLLDPFDGCLSVIGDCCLGNKVDGQTRQLLLEPNEPFLHYPGQAIMPKNIEFDCFGTESKPIINSISNTITETMLWTCRTVRRKSDDETLCTEVTAWSRGAGDSRYVDRRACYFPGSFRLLDIDAKNRRVFVCFKDIKGGSGVLKLSPLPKNNELFVYPLISYESQKRGTTNSPKVALTIECEDPISSFSIDSIGETITVATTCGSIEVWKVASSIAQRIETIRFRNALKQSIKARLIFLWKWRINASNLHMDRSTNDPCVLRRHMERLEAAPIEAFYLSKHLPASKCGFVTSQKNGSALLLWKPSKDTVNFEIASLINPPLDTNKQEPQIKYDGSKLLVLGEDIQGTTLLVYQIASSDLPVDDLLKRDLPYGGVYNLTDPPCVRFANQIRNKALSTNPNAEETMNMACNERFIVINTKTGNRLADVDASQKTEGLLIIDLEDDSN